MALAGAGDLASKQGDLDRTQEVCEEGLALLEHEASEAKLFLLGGSGFMAWQREDYGRATRLFEEGLALSRELSDTW